MKMKYEQYFKSTLFTNPDSKLEVGKNIFWNRRTNKFSESDIQAII